MISTAVIIIGDEILLGHVTDTNSGFIARTLEPYGFGVAHIYIVGDDAADIEHTVREAMDSHSLVITTGGLGPTKDDITKNVLCCIFDGELRHDPEVMTNVEGIFRRRGLNMNHLTATQALVPTSCRVIQNRLGTAPIMWFERDGHVLVSMPGVPFETQGMLVSGVLPELSRHFGTVAEVQHRQALLRGVCESDLATLLSYYEQNLPEGAHLAYLPNIPTITLRLDDSTGKAEEHFGELLKLIEPYLLATEETSVPKILVDTLREKALTASTAESCTGGRIAADITSIPGSSDVFLAGIVSYANSAKENILGVPPVDLRMHGAVSEPVVRAMLDGACRVSGADCAMATSGVAGPGGGTPDKPVGTVWIGVKLRDKVVVKLYHFPGDRARVTARAATTAQIMLLDLLEERLDSPFLK